MGCCFQHEHKTGQPSARLYISGYFTPFSDICDPGPVHPAANIAPSQRNFRRTFPANRLASSLERVARNAKKVRVREKTSRTVCGSKVGASGEFSTRKWTSCWGKRRRGSKGRSTCPSWRHAEVIVGANEYPSVSFAYRWRSTSKNPIEQWQWSVFESWTSILWPILINCAVNGTKPPMTEQRAHRSSHFNTSALRLDSESISEDFSNREFLGGRRGGGVGGFTFL